MARTKKTASKSNDDATAAVEQLTLTDPDDELIDPEEDDDDKNEDGDETVPMKGLSKSTPARSTRVEDRAICISWYHTFINVTQEAAEYLYDREELTKPSDWSILNDKTVGMIVKNCRDSDVHVNATATCKMVLLAFLCKHQERIQRPLFEMSTVDEDMLEDIERQMQLEEQYMNEKTEADPPSLPLDEANVTRSISAFQSIASRKRGITNIPLSYVIRFNPHVPAAHLDPPFGTDDSDYPSMDDEMIRRAEIYSREVNVNEDKGPFSKVFLIDAATVFTLMEKAFGKTSFWTNARQYARKKEGRKAWIALIKFHFGNDRVTTMADSLRTKLQKTQFSGPRRGFDFTKYCNLHTNAHTSASDILLYQQDQSPIFSEVNKIFLFQNGITDPYFNTVKALVNSQRYKYDTFEKVREEYLNYMRTSPRPDQIRDLNDTRNISETRTNKNFQGKGKKKPSQAEIDACTHIQLKKYSNAEYNKMTLAERAKHYQLKKAAGWEPPKKRTVAQVSETDDTKNESEATSSANVTNSTNPALVRQSKLPKTE